LATLVTTFSFSQQDDFSLQDVWVLVPHPALSEQLLLALLEVFALSALTAFFAAEDLPSPACANGSNATVASVKQTNNFFIIVSDSPIVMIVHFPIALLTRLSKRIGYLFRCARGLLACLFTGFFAWRLAFLCGADLAWGGDILEVDETAASLLGRATDRTKAANARRRMTFFIR
jgi:hypothetical protein